MKLILSFLAGSLALASILSAQPVQPAAPLARNDAEKKVLSVLENIVRQHKTYLSVPMEDGRALRLLTEASGARTVVEIGTSTGYSGLWFCLALLPVDGHLTTFELDRGRAAIARGHFREAGVERLVTIIEGDAHKSVAALKTPIDVVFIDADKGGYLDYLNKLLPMVKPGGLILAHNIEMAPDYVKAVSSNPALETIFYMQGGGLGVTVKKR
ncbi:MAG: class I SAM-dependent methyltransferase [Bryobacteraceae bacterium]